MGERIWCYAGSEDDERWLHAGPTRDDAIAEGTETFEGRPFFICPAWPLGAVECFPDARRLLDGVAEHVQDEYGAEDWPELDGEQMKAFEADYKALVEKYFPGEVPFSELCYREKERIEPRPAQLKGDGGSDG